jgi:hypothetical protein
MLPAMGDAREIAGFSQSPHDLWQRHGICGGINFRNSAKIFWLGLDIFAAKDDTPPTASE